MKNAKVVIGAAFGDEGKGLMTDYLASSTTNPIVVRYNGGSQAGHTVVTPDGKRHVFSHIGSGAFANADTYLSQFFITNPTFFWREVQDLDGRTGYVYVHPRGRLSTPFDVLLNQIRDGSLKHGSCGYGINETVVRCHTDFETTNFYLNNPELLRKKLEVIRDLWVPIRLRQMGIIPDAEAMYAIQNPALIDDYIRDVDHMRKAVRLREADVLELKDVIFEGAQGLLLDEEHHFFPHVTRSRTGLPNVRKIAAEAGITDLDVFYMTRAYTTRHGNGPLPHHDPDLSYEDDTNAPNKWQGSLRFSPLDLDLIGEAVNNDLRDHSNITAHVMITHMDQMTSLDCAIGGKVYEDLAMQRFFDYTRVATRIGRIGISTGPTRNHIQEGI